MLPRWRGAAPIQRTILAGDLNTEVCIMQMDEGMDTGDILLKQEVSIHEQMTSKELHDLAAEIGGKLVLDTVSAIAMGAIKPVKQSMDGVLHAAKLTRADELINWQKSAFEIYCQIRAFSPRPGAYFKYNNEVIKIIQADYIAGDASQFQPGEVVDAEFTIACGDGFLKPTLLQREGRKMIYNDAFLRGFPIAPGTLFG
jgi:methionyl-tRNA formyltransferase